MIKTNVYAHDFGIIIPCKSGVIWEQQTNGVCCHHIEIEGIYIPLERPYIDDCMFNDLLQKLSETNYTCYNSKYSKKIWREINIQLPFIYKCVSRFDDIYTQEGMQWIKILRVKKSYKGMKIDKYHYNTKLDEWKDLIGKTVALIYPNSD